MGCGGSRADAIEPRYYESWTRETESTWLTNTDSESPPQEGGGAEAGGREPGAPHPGSMLSFTSAPEVHTGTQACSDVVFPNMKSGKQVQKTGVLEDGKSAQTGVTAASATAGTLSTEKRNNSAPQCATPMVHGAGATTQRQNGFRTAESKRDTQKMSTKEVTINITKSTRQSDRRKTKNCVN